MLGSIIELYHYPIKGLSAQRLTDAQLTAGEGFPFDRIFGFARYDSGFDPARPEPIPKDRFIVLVKEERLAGLKSSFDSSSRHLKLEVQGNTVLVEDLSTFEGVEAAVSFFSTMFDLNSAQRPVFASSGEHRFTDVSVVSKELMNAVSLINLDSVREFGERIGAEVDPLRFRANIYFEGWQPFSELDLIGREFTIGSVRLKGSLRTRRCAATEVNPKTAKRDLPVPRLIMQNYNHADMGIYAEVLSPGKISPGDAIIF